jgi:hypothetical protein
MSYVLCIIFHVLCTYQLIGLGVSDDQRGLQTRLCRLQGGAPCLVPEVLEGDQRAGHLVVQADYLLALGGLIGVCNIVRVGIIGVV